MPVGSCDCAQLRESAKADASEIPPAIKSRLFIAQYHSAMSFPIQLHIKPGNIRRRERKNRKNRDKRDSEQF
jgi:hypothetical protein